MYVTWLQRDFYPLTISDLPRFFWAQRRAVTESSTGALPGVWRLVNDT